MSICKLCGAQIMFVRTKLSARMPLDAEPNPEGTIELVEEEDGVVAVLVGNLTLFDMPDNPHYMPHWGTCTGDIEKVRKR